MDPSPRLRAPALAFLLALAALGTGCVTHHGWGWRSVGPACDAYGYCYDTRPGFYARPYGYVPYSYNPYVPYRAYRGYGPLPRLHRVYVAPAPPWGDGRHPHWDGDGSREQHRAWLDDVDRRQAQAEERQRAWEDRHLHEQQETEQRLRDASRPPLWPPPLPPRPPRGVYPTWERAIRPF